MSHGLVTSSQSSWTPSKGYATKYNVAAATITKLANALTWPQWVFANITTAQVGSRTLTRFKNASIDGTVMPTVPAAAVYSTLLTVPYEPGVMSLAASVAQQINRIQPFTQWWMERTWDWRERRSFQPTPAATAPVLQTRPGNGGMTEVM